MTRKQLGQTGVNETQRGGLGVREPCHHCVESRIRAAKQCYAHDRLVYRFGDVPIKRVQA